MARWRVSASMTRIKRDFHALSMQFYTYRRKLFLCNIYYYSVGDAGKTAEQSGDDKIAEAFLLGRNSKISVGNGVRHLAYASQTRCLRQYVGISTSKTKLTLQASDYRKLCCHSLHRDWVTVTLALRQGSC